MLQKGEPMDDLISRQAAIEAVKSEKVKVFHELYDEAWNDAINGCIDVIEQLPSAQPKRGKWILDRSGAYCCSECMEPCATYVMMKPRDKYCKMCGSRNEVTT